MTDPTPRPDDELVSAVLDGEATADERALVEADPAARERLDQLRTVRDLIAAPVAVPADVRESAIAAALAEFGSATTSGEPAGDELESRRSRRRGTSGGRFLAAAAAVVVLVLGAAGVLRVLNPPVDVNVASSQSAPTTRPQPAEDAAGEPERTTNAPEAGAVTSTTAPTEPGAPSTTSSAETSAPALDALGSATVVTTDLGRFASTRELRDRMLGIVDARTADASSGVPATTTAPSPTSGSGAAAELGGFASCASYLDAIDPELDQLLAVGAGTYQDRPATVFAFSVDRATHPSANGSIRIYAVDPTTCATLSVLTTR